jgi:hypothetical protein
MRLTRFLLVLAALAAASIQAQQIAGSIVGTVTDASGSVVPDAAITITSVRTNAARETKTDTSGNYTLPFLSAGEYRITSNAKGFRLKTVENAVLQVGQTLRVDFQLDVGDAAQTVEVQAAVTSLQTENATVGAVLDAQKIVDLPLNGRNFVQLAQLIPGVQPGTPGSITVRRGRGSIGQGDSPFGSTGMQANGVRDTGNRYFIDGVESMDGDAFTYAFAPSVDSLAEFKVETSSYSAESGAAPGGQISLITKSGTNRFHGTLWEFNRNDALTSAYNAIGQQDLKAPRLNRNQFGGNIGGPVSVPKLYEGRDKTFFFFNWESGRQAAGAVAGYRIVPTEAQRNGDLRGLLNAQTGQPIVLRDVNNIGIVNNVIPKSFISPQAQAILDATPLPNTQNGVFNYVNTPQSPVSTQDNYTARIDHNFSSRDTVSGRYFFNDTLENGTPYWGHDERNNLARTQGVATTYTRTFSPQIVNQLRVGWNFIKEYERFGTTNDPSFDIAGKLNIPLTSRRPQDYGPPRTQIGGSEGGFSVFDLQQQIGPRDRGYEVWQISDGLSWQRGRHLLKFGFEFDKRFYTKEQARDPRGLYRFDGIYTGSGMADFMLGYLTSATINPVPTLIDMSSLWQSYYVNDEWRVTQNLTITAGLRYDYFPRWQQFDNKIINIGQNGFAVTDFITPENSPYGASLLSADGNNFGPRFGFAWRPSFIKDFVIRGGYGIYYQQEHPNANATMVEGAQATAGSTVNGTQGRAPDVLWSNPFVSVQAPVPTFDNATSIDPDMRDAYIQQWNFMIQKKLPWDLVWDAGYVGSKGTRLSVAFDPGALALNRPIELVDPRTPGLASINARRPNQQYQRAVSAVKSIGNSNYHGLQTKLERRMARGVTILTAYTWSKAMSGPHDQGGLIGNGSFIGSPQDYYNLKNEHSLAGFDVTQRFVQTVMYEPPALKTSGWSRVLTGGWRFGAIITAMSGFPAGIADGRDTTGTGQGSRADVVLGQEPNLASEQRTWQRWFNTDAFALAQWGAFGTSARTGAIRLPGLINTDFAIDKSFRIGERTRLELRSEFFNLFRHFNPEPGSVDRGRQSRTFGAVGGGVQGVATRIIQLGAKPYF